VRRRLRLNKLLRAGTPLTSALDAVFDATEVAFEVVDPQGRALLTRGTVDSDAPTTAVTLDEAKVGGVRGRGVAAYAGLLKAWVEQEGVRKALAAEALGAYREITLLYKLSEQLSGSLQSQHLLSVALAEAGRVIPQTWGVLLLEKSGDDEAEATIVTATKSGDDRAFVDHLWGLARQHPKPELVNDLRADSRFASVADEAPVQAVLWAPLATPNGLLGVLALGHAAVEREYVAADLSLLTTIASQAAPSIENAMVYENMERLVEQRTAELREAMEQAEAASRAKSLFLASMSHELRTPLNAVLGFAQILKRDGDLTDKQANGLAVIERSGEHLLTLITDLLDLSRIEAGAIEARIEDFSLRELLGNLAEIFRLRAAECELGFGYEVDGIIPTSVMGDERRLRQVLMNLLSNAMKYTDPGGEVQLRVAWDQGVTRFEVSDSGIGISEDDQQEIFEAFRQVINRNRVSQGTGLGLAISHRLVQVMGGELRVRSTPGEGSRFGFSIPMPRSGSTTLIDTLDVDVMGFEGGPYTVLTVEDDPLNRLIVRQLLEPLGFEVHEAINGREGLHKALELRPHVVLMDLIMPEMTGYAAIEEMRARSELDDVVIIVLSASVFPVDQEDAMKAGGDDFVAKPIRADEFITKLGKHLGITWKRSRRSASAEAQARDALPPRTSLDSLLEAARLGRIAGVRSALDAIEALDPRYAEFVAAMRVHARNFQLDRICGELERVGVS